MNYLIIGAGAVGTILANCLKLEKEDKIFAIRSKKSSDKILNIEVDIIEHLKDKIKLNKNVIYQYDEEIVNIAFVTVKSNQLENMKDILQTLNCKVSKIVCLMNGMGWEDYFKSFDTVYGIVMYNAFKIDNKVILGSKGGLIIDEAIKPKLEGRISSLPVQYAKDIQQYRYRKLWLNTINGFLSLFGFSLFQLFEESKKYDYKPLIIFKNYLEETGKLFDRLSIKSSVLPSLDPLDLISLIEKIINKKELNQKEEILFNNLPKGKNSTLQSIEKKEETEYRFIGGYLVNIAEKINFQYILNKFVTEKILNYDRTKEFKFIQLSSIMDMI
ncbi:MAG: ketopantoate reductase family protein [Exilispira sp.]